MLHTLLKAESSSDFVAFGKLNLSENSALFLMGGAQQRGANLDECELELFASVCDELTSQTSRPTRPKPQYAKVAAGGVRVSSTIIRPL